VDEPAITRFDPPTLELDGVTLWVLQRAFGPPDLEVAPPADPGAAVACAGALGVATRIACRAAPLALARELGANLAAACEFQARKVLTATLAYDALASRVARHAAELDHPVVYLKGYALHAGGRATPGSRPIGDLDLLVPEDRARPFHDALRGDGFVAAQGAANEQHLPPLAAPGWGVVDVHFSMRGVCDPSGLWLDATRVLGAPGAAELRPGAWVPGPTLLAAHALAHAIEQHGTNPRPYPLLRVVADLQDLLPNTAAWEAGMPSLRAWLHPTLLPAEVEGARELTLALAAGRVPRDPDTGAARLLAHFVAHALDTEYRSSLGGEHLRHRLRQARQRGTLLRYAGRKLRDLWRRVATP